MTGSPFALAFAVLGPVIALASLTDGKLHGRRRARRERQRFRRELAATRRLIDEHHGRERAELVAAVDRLRCTAGDAIGDPERWRDDGASTPVVSIGLGLVRSALRLDDAPRAPDDGEADAALDALWRQAADLSDAPFLVDPFLGIGVCGPTAIAEAAAREILLQLAGLLSPLQFSLAMPLR